MPLPDPEKIPDGHREAALAPLGLDNLTADEVITWLAKCVHTMEARVKELEDIVLEKNRPSLMERTAEMLGLGQTAGQADSAQAATDTAPQTPAS